MSLRAFIEEENAAAELARIERERPIKEMTAQLAATHGQLLSLARQRVKVAKDAEFDLASIDPEMVSVKMTKNEATEFNGREAETFTANESRYKRCPESENAMLEYAERNGLQVVSARMWQAIFERLLELNLIDEWQPEPEPIPNHEPVIEQEHQPVHDEYEVGIDLETGLDRAYTRRQVAAMSADQYRRSFGLKTVNRNGEQLR
jgi:hypothetical protein